MKMQQLFLAVMLGVGSISMVNAMQDGGNDTVLQKKTFAAICDAARREDYEELRRLLKNNASLNARDKSLDEAVCDAAQRGDCEELCRLLKDNADLLNARNEFGKTVLMLSAMDGDLKIVKVLLSNAAQRFDESGYAAFVNARDGFGWTALMFASTNGHDEVVKVLLSAARQKLDQTSYAACVNARDTFLKRTALMFASSNGCAAAAQVLLDAGADADLRDKEGLKAFDLAWKYGHSEVIQAFKEYSSAWSVKAEVLSKLS
jgi:ankyrin repeat protein